MSGLPKDEVGTAKISVKRKRFIYYQNLLLSRPLSSNISGTTLKYYKYYKKKV